MIDNTLSMHLCIDMQHQPFLLDSFIFAEFNSDSVLYKEFPH